MSFIQVTDSVGESSFIKAVDVQQVVPAKHGCILRLQGRSSGLLLKSTAGEVLGMLQTVDLQANHGQPVFCVVLIQESPDLSEWAVRSILARQQAPQA